jgi:hypothetical protein
MSSSYFQASASDIVLTRWARWLITWHSIGIAYARSLGLRVTILHDEILVERPSIQYLRMPNMQNIPRSKP